MHHANLVDPGLGPGQVQRLHHVGGLHRRPQHPGDDVACVIIQYRRQVVPAPAHDLQVGKVRLPKLVGPSRWMPKRFRRRQHDEGWTRNQVIRLEDAIDARFREKVALLARQPPCQFPRRSLGIRQRGVDNPLPYRQWNPVPLPTVLEIAVIPAIKRGSSSGAAHATSVARATPSPRPAG